MTFKIFHIILSIADSTKIKDSIAQPIQGLSIIEAQPIPFTYETIGWKIVFSICFILILFSTLYILIRIRRRKYRREGVRIVKSLSSPKDIGKLMGTVKAIAIQTFGRESVAELNGSEWINFVSNKTKQEPLNVDTEKLERSVYSSEKLSQQEFDKIKEYLIVWIRKHRI